MPTTPITDPASGESLVGTEPQLDQQVDPGYWRQRLNLYTGRALTVSALDSEQFYRGGLLATLGQAVSAGTVSGLALTMNTNGADPVITVTPGYGITASGQDVVLNTTLKTTLSTLPVIDTVTGEDLYTFHQSVGDPTNTTYAGILLLQPVVAQVSGQLLDSGNLPAIVSGNLAASCGQDPAEYAYEDWQIADAVRLVYLPWPGGVPALPLPPAAPPSTWRNRLAYAIFEAEALLGPDDQLPWAMLGLPVALIAFDPGTAWRAQTAYALNDFITDSNSNLQLVTTAGTTSAGPQPPVWSTAWGGQTTDGSVTWTNTGLAWKPLFVDCSAVVRAGGLPRNRYVLPAQPAPLSVWQSGGIYAAGDFIIDPGNNIQLAQTAGTAGIAPPPWSAVPRKTTQDGTVTWVNNGSANWRPNTSYALNQFIYDANNNMQHVLLAGISGNKEPDWNGVYLPTTDGTVTWINNGSGNPPVVQPALAQARINQLSEQLSQAMVAQTPYTTLADMFATLPPSGILPASAVNFTNQTAPGFPPNWTLSAAPVHLEELETVLETGMLMDPIDAATSAPADSALLEPVEILVPLPDSLYDPDILVVDTVPPIFYQEQAQATDARNLTLKRLETVQQEINTLFTALGPNVPSNPNLIDPDDGLTPDEVAGRNTPPPYAPASTETFGAVLQSTWLPSVAYTAGQFVIDGNGMVQVALTSGTSTVSAPAWNTGIQQTTADGVTWVCRGKPAWQAGVKYLAGQLIVDSSGNIEQVATEGNSGSQAPAWATTAFANTTAGAVIWTAGGSPQWQANNSYAVGDMILDDNQNLQVVVTAGKSGNSAPTWNPAAGQTTADNTGVTPASSGVTWNNLGTPTWQPNTNYAAKTVILDSNGNIQTVTTAGVSGNSTPNWPQPPEPVGQTTTDGLTWVNLGHAGWVKGQTYAAPTVNGFPVVILDGNGFIQAVQTAGASGEAPPAWNDTAGGATQEASITWLNNGPWGWQPNTAYIAGQFVVDPQGYRQNVSNPGTSALSPPRWLQPEGAGQIRQDGTVTWQSGGLAYWEAGHAYTAGQMIVDGNGNVQSVKTAGTSASEPPIWDPNFGQPTQDGAAGGLVWTNLGHATWQPNTSYSKGQVVIDSTGSIQTAITGGVTASSTPNWYQTAPGAGQTTPDGILWQSGGSAIWQSDFLYAPGQLIVVNGNVQSVQTGGISGDSSPAWNQNAGQTTQDGGVTWLSLGNSSWKPNTRYATGQAILETNGNIQIAIAGGVSGANAPAWNEGTGATTQDVSFKWINAGPLTWVANTKYTIGQIVIDSNGNLQSAWFLDANGNSEPGVTSGTSGAAAPVWSTTPAGATIDGAITWVYVAYLSTDLQQLTAIASQAPYTSTFYDSTGAPITISLLSAADLTKLETNGLQALITDLSARISQANDLLDSAFLIAQTDIYRFRQNVLGATAASSLATSTVLANIATGTTAAATAGNLQSYIGSILPSTTSTTTGGTTTTTTTAPPFFKRPISVPFRDPVILNSTPILNKAPILNLAPKMQSLRSSALTAAMNDVKTNTAGMSRIGSVSATLSGVNRIVDQQPLAGLSTGASVLKTANLIDGADDFSISKAAAGPAQIVIPGQNVAATATDITSQSPLAGAQLNIRTLTIAERMAQSPSQEAMFYAISNRLAFLQALAALETDLNLVADDLPILVDGLPDAPSTVPVPVPVVRRTFSEWLKDGGVAIQAQIQAPYLINDAPEATLFSVGVRVVEQHTMLLRALEARVQQYSDFVTLCTNATQSIQTDIQQAQTYAAQLTNNLLQDRQNVAFTTALLGDEIQQVASVNAQRQQVLATSVQLIAYTRARTLETTDTVPSRQLVPANVTNPVPACLQQSVSIPPELREVIGQLREAPVSWLPAAASQVNNLERPVLLQQLALSVQARAAQMLQMPQLPSSAAGETGVYAATISKVYTTNQQMFRGYLTQRASIQPAALANMSWSSQVQSIVNIAAINDLISADSVHAEISNAVARLIQQISSVATCLYARVSIAQPIDRLTWAEYLTGAGLTVQLQSLAVLPGWNQLAYTDRQQMQMLVDWLFLQVETTISAATAFMSDVVRTAILLASDVPVDNIIPGSVIARTLPVMGGIVSLNLPSDRISSGMFVNLYSGATLAARAVVSDLDSSTVNATVTDVFTPGIYLNAADSAHFTTLTPQAIALRPLFTQS
jgi:hypothetical protein